MINVLCPFLMRWILVCLFCLTWNQTWNGSHTIGNSSTSSSRGGGVKRGVDLLGGLVSGRGGSGWGADLDGVGWGKISVRADLDRGRSGGGEGGSGQRQIWVVADLGEERSGQGVTIREGSQQLMTLSKFTSWKTLFEMENIQVLVWREKCHDNPPPRSSDRNFKISNGASL